MSRIYFHEQGHKALEIPGTERFYAGGFCGRLLAVATDYREYARDLHPVRQTYITAPISRGPYRISS